MLESHKFISSDGLDWIIEGRILGTEGLVLPVLRNIGYVLSSRLDWILGEHGYVFAVINIAGLLLQGISLITLLNFLNVKTNLQTLGLIIYFGSWIHFSSLYILPDSFAVGCLVFGTTMYACRENMAVKHFLFTSFTLFMGSLFQFYVLAGFVFSIALIVQWQCSRLKRAVVALSLFATMGVSIGITILWRQSIPHASVPSQFDLLAINLNMLPFYGHTWSAAFMVLALLILGYAKKDNFIKSIRVKEIRFFIFFSLVFLGLAFFYQWPDARIAYSGISFSLLVLIGIFFTSISDLAGSSKPGKLRISESIRGLSIFSLALTLFMAPNDYWTPKFFEIRPLHTWYLLVVKDILSNSPSNYKDVSVRINNSCGDSKKKSEILDSVANSGFSPYEKIILTTYAKNLECSRN